jgi:tRNA1(Val) A37 N6-methylase TrmN6
MKKIIEDNFKELKLNSYSNTHLPNSASVFLAFSSYNMIKPNMNILEIGSGIGHVSIVLAKLNPKSNFFGIEIQEKIYKFSQENLVLNDCNNINFVNDDFRNIEKYFPKEFFDLIISNPPHYISGEKSKNTDRETARSFKEDDVKYFMKNSWKMIKNKKNLNFVLHTNTFREFFYHSINNKLEPYEIIPALGKNSKNTQLISLKLRKNGGKNLNFRKPYII